MKVKVLKKLTTTLLIGFAFGASQIAQAQTTVEKGKTISIEIPADTDTACNIEVVRGGEKTDVRVESNKKGVYQFAGRELGEETIRWEGKMKFRGLKTLGPCRGDGAIRVVTTESAETLKAQEAESLMAAQAAKLAELEAKLKAAEAEAAKTPEQREADRQAAAEAKALAEAQLAAEIKAAEKARVAEMKAAEEARVAAEARAQVQARARAAEQARLAEQARAEAQARAETEKRQRDEANSRAANKMKSCLEFNKPMLDFAINLGWINTAQARNVLDCAQNSYVQLAPSTYIYFYQRSSTLGMGRGRFSRVPEVCANLLTGQKYVSRYAECETR